MNPRYSAFETSTLTHPDEPTSYRIRDKHANPGVMVSVLVSKAVDRGFIGGIMVNVLVSKVVDRGFIGGIMVSVLVWKAVDRGIYHFREKNATI
jgi:hypothetical protein